MPLIQPSSKVLVTGANGYVAAWLVRSLLEKGYAVRGTLRALSKAQHLNKLFESYGDKFEIAIVEDITKPGAFDEAVKGIDAIVHVASPVNLKADDPNELIIPAVQGTVGILESASKHGHALQRVVITSSCAAVLRVTSEPHIFTEADWNDQAVEEVNTRGRDAMPMAKYRASKTLAERAAWSFVSEHAGKLKWNLVVINPPYVFGPLIHAVSTVDELNASLIHWHSAVLGATPPTPAILATGSSWIDVRDLAVAHILALERQEASGERIIVSEGPFVWQEWLDAANRVAGQVKLSPDTKLHIGVPTSSPVHLVNFDTSKAARILHLGPGSGDGKEGWYKLRGMDECARDILANFVQCGWA